MTTCFKHMTREHAERMSRGEIRIGSFTYYHEQEHSGAIKDSLEGITVGQLNPVILSSTERHETMVAGLKFVTENGGAIVMGDNRFIRLLPPLYIFSTSAVDAVGHFSCYDTIVRINDFEEFGRIIVNGRPDLFHGYVCDRVRYAPRTYDAFNHPGLEPDPFLKDDAFAQDQEFRLVLFPVADVEPHLTFTLEEIQHAFVNGLCKILE